MISHVFLWGAGTVADGVRFTGRVLGGYMRRNNRNPRPQGMWMVVKRTFPLNRTLFLGGCSAERRTIGNGCVKGRLLIEG